MAIEASELFELGDPSAVDSMVVGGSVIPGEIERLSRVGIDSQSHAHETLHHLGRKTLDTVADHSASTLIEAFAEVTIRVA